MDTSHNPLKASGSTEGDQHLHGDRVRVRKRIRVKKKRSPKKKIRKFFERVVWTIVLIGFAITLFYLLKELDLSDERYKKKKTNSFLIKYPKHNSFNLETSS